MRAIEEARPDLWLAALPPTRPPRQQQQPADEQEEVGRFSPLSEEGEPVPPLPARARRQLPRFLQDAGQHDDARKPGPTGKNHREAESTQSGFASASDNSDSGGDDDDDDDDDQEQDHRHRGARQRLNDRRHGRRRGPDNRTARQPRLTLTEVNDRRAALWVACTCCSRVFPTYNLLVPQRRHSADEEDDALCRYCEAHDAELVCRYHPENGLHDDELPLPLRQLRRAEVSVIRRVAPIQRLIILPAGQIGGYGGVVHVERDMAAAFAPLLPRLHEDIVVRVRTRLPVSYRYSHGTKAAPYEPAYTRLEQLRLPVIRAALTYLIAHHPGYADVRIAEDVHPVLRITEVSVTGSDPIPRSLIRELQSQPEPEPAAPLPQAADQEEEEAPRLAQLMATVDTDSDSVSSTVGEAPEVESPSSAMMAAADGMEDAAAAPTAAVTAPSLITTTTTTTGTIPTQRPAVPQANRAQDGGSATLAAEAPQPPPTVSAPKDGGQDGGPPMLPADAPQQFNSDQIQRQVVNMFVPTLENELYTLPPLTGQVRHEHNARVEVDGWPNLFPRGRGHFFTERAHQLRRHEYVARRLMGRDLRYTQDECWLFAQYANAMRRRISNRVSYVLRCADEQDSVTAREALHRFRRPRQAPDLLRHRLFHRVASTIPNTGPYWQQVHMHSAQRSVAAHHSFALLLSLLCRRGANCSPSSPTTARSTSLVPGAPTKSTTRTSWRCSTRRWLAAHATKSASSTGRGVWS